MRPRVFPAEDRRRRRTSTRGVPRRFNEAAGIPRGRPSTGSPASRASSCFNEAAGIPRGRLQEDDPGVAERDASMRPRVFPAEDTPDQPVAMNEILAHL